jgi:diacylglycerol kinase family enzyme
MQDKINDLQQESIQDGLKINIGKTKEMRINTKNKNPIQIDGNIIENVENFTYLGSNVSIRWCCR